MTDVDAGHLPGILRRANGTFERVVRIGRGLALGMFEQAEYTAGSTSIAPGDEALFTDGIPEAETPGGRPFDETGLEVMITAQAASDPKALSRTVFKAVDALDSARLADDLTTLVLQRVRP